MPVTIVVRNLSERIFQIVREQIVLGQHPEDLPIRQDALAADLGVSKIPLREALARLEQEGLLTSQANHGYFVRPLSAEQADEIYALRLSIEPMAAAFAAQQATATDQENLQLAFERLDKAAHANIAEVAIRNREFHTALVAPGGRRLTTELVERLAILAERYVIAHLEPAGRDARAHLEHRDLLDAWMSRDSAALQTLLSSHISATLDDLKQQFDAASRTA